LPCSKTPCRTACCSGFREHANRPVRWGPSPAQCPFHLFSGIVSHMDFGLREWLIVIGSVVIAGILFDGWRRLGGGKGKLKFKLDRSLSELPDDEPVDPNLIGPVRVVKRDQEPTFDEQDLPSFSAKDINKRRGVEPRQGDLELDSEEPVPTLLTPVEESAAAKPAANSQKDLPPVEEVLVINVVARHPEGFKGPALLQSILESGLRFG